MISEQRPEPRLTLVVPPFFSLDYPCLQSGMLRSAARDAGWAVHDRYLNQAFADLAGRDAAWRLALQSRVVELGEYVGAAPLREAAGVAHSDSWMRDRLGEQLQLTEQESREMLALGARLGPFLQAVAAEECWRETDLCLIACQHQQLAAGLSLARALRARWPDLPLYLHGEQVASQAQAQAALAAEPALSGVIWRDAPTVVRHGLQALREGRALPGVVGRGAGPVQPLPGERVMPRPDYDGFFPRFRPTGRPPVLPYRLSWGCWWAQRAAHCSFCGLVGEERVFVARAVEIAVRDVLSLCERYETLSVVTADLLPEYADVEALLRAAAERDLDLEFFFEVRPDLSRARLRRLADYGGISLLAGIETLDSRALRGMGKGTDRLRVVAFLKHCAEFGLPLTWTWLLGFPEEGPESYLALAELIPRLCHLPPPHGMAQARVERSSPWFQRPQDFGLVLDGPDETLRRAYPFEESLVAGLASRFRHRFTDGRDVLEQARPLIAAVESWRRAWRPGGLTYQRGPGHVLIRDRRAQSREIVLRGWRARAYELLLEPRTPARVLRELADSEPAVSAAELDGFLAELERLGLVLGEAGRWLALAVRAPRGADRTRTFLPLEER
ncbi:RiPP maturation radical SAM C-methyltransferase [Alkalilimnicola sp. S0819]|uniref:RiPP maturation radical SAM C-methyltransferase n=1 Tax=Alkalilimnicola sp. S0819 TaxID=2613922 RepID=UPI00186A9320|nr:RiPP maturation radical SAM C-methyltransferase [Alkalilimnicola sp. S0819]